MRAGARPPQRHSRAASGASAAPRPRCCPGHHRPVACAAAGGTGAGGGGAPSSLASGVRTAEAAGAVAAVQPPPPAPAPLPPPRPGPPSLVYVCDVEERALQNALRTAEAAEAGTLPRRALAYAAVDDAVLSAAYDRCGTVTEDYGRTFYMGAAAPRGGARAALNGEREAGPFPSRRSVPRPHAQPPAASRRPPGAPQPRS